jgi:predicted RNA-binding protein with PIN domain
VLSGSRDRLAPESWAKRIADAIPAAELQTIPDAPRASAASAAPALANRVGDFLATATALRGAARDVPDDRDGPTLKPLEAGNRLIVDGMNVIGSRPDGWWRDRPKAWRDLRRSLEHYAKDTGDDVILVLDGRRPAGWREDGLVETAFAAGGRDAADHSIVARVEADPHPETLSVVTSDRGLAERVEKLGAETLPASAFREHLIM